MDKRGALWHIIYASYLSAMHTEVIVRTTLDLPEDLVKEAIRLSHFRTKTGVIIRALEDFVRKNKLQELKKFKGKVALDVDLPSLRDRK